MENEKEKNMNINSLKFIKNIKIDIDKIEEKNENEEIRREDNNNKSNEEIYKKRRK